jgi:hypothetical protein
VAQASRLWMLPAPPPHVSAAPTQKYEVNLTFIVFYDIMLGEGYFLFAM